MPTDAATRTVGTISLRVSRGALASLAVAVAMLSSSVVFSEPAPVDALMIGVIVGVPVLGAGKLNRAMIVNACLWLVLVACGIIGTIWSATFDTAIKHQLVTLFLFSGCMALASYIAQDPSPRIRLVFWCYTLGCLVAAVAAVAGFFNLLPGAHDLFTRFGRGRGTFKDPNVLGAALVPALVFLAWIVLREPAAQLRRAAVMAAPMLVALLLSFSRGAWISCVVALSVVAAVTFTRTRRVSDQTRFLMVVAFSGLIGILGLGVALQFDSVQSLLTERATLDQSYDQGPDGRFGGQAKAARLILANPLGIGTHTFRDVHHHEEAHNVYLSMFLNAGWLGGLAYLASVLISIGLGLRASLKISALQGPILVATAAFAGVAFEGIIIDSDHWRSFFVVQGCLWGLLQVSAAARTDAVRREGGAADAGGGNKRPRRARPGASRRT